MLRAEEDHFLALNPSTPCHEPHPTTSSLGAAHHRCGASPDPQVVFLGMRASSASPALYSCRWFGPSGHTLCSLLHCEPTHAPTLLYAQLSLHPASQVRIPARHCRGAPQAHPEPQGHLKAREGAAAGSCSSSGSDVALMKGLLVLLLSSFPATSREKTEEAKPGLTASTPASQAHKAAIPPEPGEAQASCKLHTGALPVPPLTRRKPQETAAV